MTRREFIDDVNSFSELIDFCQNEGLDHYDDIYDAEYLNTCIMDIIGEMNDWTQVRDFVSGIPTRCDYYRDDGCGSYEDADDYFNDYKDDVIRYMDDVNGWEEEDPEEEEDDEEEPIVFGRTMVSEEDTEEDEEIETACFMAALRRAS